jgi:hypothetical protein
VDCNESDYFHLQCSILAPLKDLQVGSEVANY